MTHANLYFHCWHEIQAKESKTFIHNLMTVPTMMMTLIKIITSSSWLFTTIMTLIKIIMIIIMIVFHDDDIDKKSSWSSAWLSVKIKRPWPLWALTWQSRKGVLRKHICEKHNKLKSRIRVQFKTWGNTFVKSITS